MTVKLEGGADFHFCIGVMGDLHIIISVVVLGPVIEAPRRQVFKSLVLVLVLLGPVLVLPKKVLHLLEIERTEK